jgi:hypothetical protein
MDRSVLVVAERATIPKLPMGRRRSIYVSYVINEVSGCSVSCQYPVNILSVEVPNIFHDRSQWPCDLRCRYEAAGMARSNPAKGMDIRVLCLLCIA